MYKNYSYCYLISYTAVSNILILSTLLHKHIFWQILPRIKICAIFWILTYTSDRKWINSSFRMENKKTSVIYVIGIEELIIAERKTPYFNTLHTLYHREIIKCICKISTKPHKYHKTRLWQTPTSWDEQRKVKHNLKKRFVKDSKYSKTCKAGEGITKSKL